MLQKTSDLPKNALTVPIQIYLLSEFMSKIFLFLFFIFQGLCIISSLFAFSPHYSLDFPLVDLVYAQL